MDTAASVVCSFRFLCDKTWAELAEIQGNPGVRYCGDCEKPVFLCTSHEDLVEHAANERCVALVRVRDEMLLGHIRLVDEDPE
jgi:hypothetical protein